MAYNDNEYKPDSPKKTTAKKEELIIPPNFISTPGVEKIQPEIISKQVTETNIQQRAIEKAVAESMKIKPEVLSSKRSAFLNKGIKQRLSGGGSGCGIITRGGSGWSKVIYYPDLSSAASSTPPTVICNLTPINTAHNIYVSIDIARYCDKIWMGIKYTDAGVNKAGILELDFNESIPSASFGRIIPLQNQNLVDLNSNSSWMAGGTGINSTTVVFSRRIGNQDDLIKFDVSGSTAIETILFQPPNNTIIGDMLYLPSSDSYVTVEYTGPRVRHYSSTGTVLGSASLASIGQSAGIFCYNGEIIVPRGGGWDELYSLDLTTMSLSLLPETDYWHYLVGDAASNPEACTNCIDPCPPPPPLLCYDIGDIGPEGGIIFSVPGVGPNTSTDTYYEVAQDDIAIGGTPNDCFNISCGGAGDIISWNVTNGHATEAQMDMNTFQFFWNAPPNVPYPGTPSNPPPQQGDVLTAITPNLFANLSGVSIPTTIIASVFFFPGVLAAGQGPIKITIADQFTPTLISPLAVAPFEFTITHQLPPLCTGFTVTGAEWGVHNKPNIITSTDFGTGHKNTDAIDAYPLLPGTPTGGINPWLDSHDIAATLCKQHGFTNDWFLPSRDELMEIMNQPLVVSQLGLNALPGFQMEHAYWTSSQYRQDPTNPIQDPHKYSWSVWNVGAGTPMLAYRCHALSVRPIRKFECVPEPPCTGCDCVEYNWRDGVCGKLVGSFCNSSWNGTISQQSGNIPPNSIIVWGTTNEGTTPGSSITNESDYDSVIGGDCLRLNISKHDVVGNTYSNSDFQNAASGYKISIWDANYNFIGKWKYDFYSVSNGTHWQRDIPDQSKRLYLENGQHLEGNYPIVSYQGFYDAPWSSFGQASATGAFFKIEWDGANSYETGCNSSIFGNPHPYYSPANQNDWPAYCGRIYTNGTFSGIESAIPRYATFQPNDLSGNPIIVHPDIYGAIPAYTGSNPGFYPNSNTMPHHCTCDYQVGDVGPAGGIIVATPNSPNSTYNASQVYGNVGDTGSNDSDYYYELSPVDLNDPTASHPNAEWGNFEITSGIDLTGIVSNGGILSVDALNNGEINTTDLMTTNPTANMQFPCGVPPCVPSAPEICDSYSLNGYNDWFLPSVHEWGFVRNNIPSISTGPTRLDNLYWTSNFWDTGVLGNNAPVTSGPISCTVMGNVPPGSSDGTYSAWSALVIDANTPSVSVPDPSGMSPELMYWHWVQNGWSNAPYPDYYLAYHVSRWLPSKVRAMRKFECAPPVTAGCTDPMSSTYDPLAIIDDGSCVYENHCWSMCGVRSGGTWYQVIDPWLDTTNPINWGPIAMENNPQPGATIPPFSTNPAVNQDYTLFYDWIITQIPALAIGDTFKFETPGYGMAVQTAQGWFACDIICFKYRGVQVWDISLPIINDGYPPPVITPSNCCVSGGSSSIVRPTNESDPRAVKMEMRRIRENFPDDGTMPDIKLLY